MIITYYNPILTYTNQVITMVFPSHQGTLDLAASESRISEDSSDFLERHLDVHHFDLF